MITEKQAEQHNRSFEFQGDFIQLKDPFSGEALRGDKPPFSLERGAGLSSGFDYLRSHPDVTFKIFGEKHGDLDISNPQEVRSQLAEADVIFLEGLGVSRNVEDLFWGVGTEDRGVRTSQSTIDAIGEYKLRQLKLLAGIRKPIFFPEIPSNGSEYEQNLLEFGQIMDDLRPMALGGDESFALAVEINISVNALLREWYMIGKMGMQMQAYEQATGTRLKNPLIWIGSLHLETMPKKLLSSGVAVNTYQAREQQLNTPLNSVSGEYARTNREVPFVEAARDGLARMIRH